MTIETMVSVLEAALKEVHVLSLQIDFSAHTTQRGHRNPVSRETMAVLWRRYGVPEEDVTKMLEGKNV